MYLLNSFSLNMLGNFPASIEVKEVGEEEARDELLRHGLDSAVGHADTAAVFGGILGLDVKPERRTVSLEKGDRVVVGQYRGPRLPEGATTLPEGATIQWMVVSVR